MRSPKPVSDARLEGLAKDPDLSDEWMNEVQGSEAQWMAQEILHLREILRDLKNEVVFTVDEVLKQTCPTCAGQGKLSDDQVVFVDCITCNGEGRA